MVVVVVGVRGRLTEEHVLRGITAIESRACQEERWKRDGWVWSLVTGQGNKWGVLAWQAKRPFTQSLSPLKPHFAFVVFVSLFFCRSLPISCVSLASFCL